MKFAVAQHMVSVFLHTTTTSAVLAFKAFARLAGTLVVLALGACTILLMLPDLWCLVLHAHRLAAAVQAWRDSGPHNSLLGRLRVHLAAAGMFAAPRDPLAECGVPGGEGWRYILQLMLLPDGRHACLERQVQLAWEEHVAFTTTVLLAAACLGLLLAFCMLGWACSRPQHPEGTEGKAHSSTPEDPERGEEKQAGRREVRHSLQVPRYLRERLTGPQGCFLEYLRRRHNILIFMDAARRRMHMKGAEEDVVLCCGAVRALLDKWRRHHTAAPE